MTRHVSIQKGNGMNKIQYEAPILNEAESMVLQMVCRYHMLRKKFVPGRVARHCGLPSWVVVSALKSLVARKLTQRRGRHYVPIMQINGAPVPKVEIYFENGIKIIKCPAMYARGYAQRKYL